MRLRYPVIGFLVLCFALRLWHLQADPPQNFPNGFRAIEPFTDEAAKAYQARNMALFGRFNTSSQDDYRFWRVLSPCWTYPLTGWFKAFGVSYASMRMFSLFWFGIGLGLLYISLRRRPGGRAGLYALFFYGVNFYILIFSRLGLMETMLNTSLLLAFTLLALSLERKWLFIPAVFSFLTAYLIKQNALLLSPVFIAGYFLVMGAPWQKKFWTSGWNWASLVAAALCAGVLWHLWNEPIYRIYTVMNLRHGYGMMPAAGGMTIRPDLLKAALAYHLSAKGLGQNFFAYDPLAAGLALLEIAAVAYLFLRRKETAKVEILAAIWVLSVQALMLTSSAQVVRFWLIQLPAIFILAGAGLYRLQKMFSGRRVMATAVVAAVLAASAAFNLQSWIEWQSHAQWQVAENAKKIEQALQGRPAVVIGKWAGPMLMPSQNQYYYVKNIFNRRPEQLQSFGITHILLGDVPSLVRYKYELENDPCLISFKTAFPQAFAQKKPVLSLPFYDGQLTLYEVDLARIRY